METPNVFLFIDPIFEKINAIRTVTTTIGVFIVFWCNSERTLTRVRQNAIRLKSCEDDLLNSEYTTWIRWRSIGIPESDAVRTDFIGILQKMVLNSKSVLMTNFCNPTPNPINPIWSPLELLSLSSDPKFGQSSYPKKRRICPRTFIVQCPINLVLVWRSSNQICWCSVGVCRNTIGHQSDKNSSYPRVGSNLDWSFVRLWRSPILPMVSKSLAAPAQCWYW